MESLEIINQKTRTAYNKAAEKYYDLFHNELEKKDFDRKLIDDYLKYFDPSSIICDAGCGPCGHIDNYIFQKGFRILGIDISEKCIEIAKNHFPRIQFETGDFTKLKYRDNYFDGLISYYSLIDTPRIYLNRVFKELNRVLKKNGYLLVTVKEGETEGYENDLIGIKTEIYYSLFREEEIKTFLEKNGFDKIKTEKRIPYKDEIPINRIFSISRKVN